MVYQKGCEDGTSSATQTQEKSLGAQTVTASWIAVVAIVVIGSLEGLAIWHGVDGTALAAAIAAIAGIGGYVAHQPRKWNGMERRDHDAR